ncbi:MAG: hypothetical protein WCI73_18625, partial [Phycisphaerae bacterium]
MSYGLLWIEILLACLLFSAMNMTFDLRHCKRMAVVVVCGSGILPPLLPLGLFVTYSAFFGHGTGAYSGAFIWAILLLICYLIGAAILLAWAMHRDEAGICCAASWSLIRLTTTWLGVVSLIVMTFWNIGLQTQLEIQALRTEAGALALAVAPPPVAESSNAAPLYKLAETQLKAAMTADDKNRDEGKAPDYTELDPRSPEVAAYLQRQQKTLELVRRAADLPACRFEPNYYSKPDIDVFSHELSAFRNAARLLGIAAKAEAAAGNTDLALADCKKIESIGGHAASSP